MKPLIENVSSRTHILARAWLVAVSLGAAAGASGQSVPAPANHDRPTPEVPVEVAAAPQNNAAADEIVTLSPFQVSTDRDVGYLANNSLAGSRLRTDLKDIASAITVYTPEFMTDINALNESDLMRYSASAVPERTDQTPAAQGISIDTGGFQFRVRGQLASRTRNFFSSTLVPDVYNSERFEQARGPNAILFGLGGAGGILNTTTKTAKLNRTFTQVGFTTDNFGLFRTTLDHNLKLHDKLAVRFNGVYSESDGFQEDSFAKNERLHFAATYRPWEKVTLRVEAEYGHVRNSLTRYFAPFDNVSLWKTRGSPTVTGLAAANAAMGIGKRNATTRVTYIGNDASFHNFAQTVFSQALTTRTSSVLMPEDWAAFDPANPFPETASFSGPGGTSEFKQKSFGVVLEMEPAKNLFIELAAVNDLRDQDVYDTTHDVFRVLGEPGTTYRDGAANPYAGKYYVDTRWVLRRARESGERFRATASYILDLGKWFGRHNFAAMGMHENTGNPRFVGFLVAAGSPFHAQPQNANNQLWTRRYITDPSDVSQYSAPSWREIPETFSVVLNQGASPTNLTPTWEKNELNDQWGHTDTALGTVQSYFLDDRLVSTLGWRYTRLTAYSRPTNAPNTNAPLSFTGPAPEATPYDFERISYSLVAKPTKSLSAYYNYSENAQPPGTTQTLIPDSSPFPLNSGEGTDYGLMVSLFDGRLFIRGGHFVTASVDQASAFAAHNVAVRNDRIMDVLIANNLIAADKVVRYTGGDFDLADLDTRGYELSIQGNLTPGWRVMVDISKSDSVQSNMLKRSRPAAALVLPLWQTAAAQNLVTSAGVTVAQEIVNYQNWLASTTAVEGTGTVGHRPFEARVFTRYDFRQGRTKGFFVGGGFSYGAAPVIGRSSSGDLFYAKVRREADFLFGYRTRLPRYLGRPEMELQFNATNLLQQHDYTLVRRDPDGQLFRAAINAPTSYTFSARFMF